jgi:hypothetical protein
LDPKDTVPPTVPEDPEDPVELPLLGVPEPEPEELQAESSPPATDIPAAPASPLSRVRRLGDIPASDMVPP